LNGTLKHSNSLRKVLLALMEGLLYALQCSLVHGKRLRILFLLAVYLRVEELCLLQQLLASVHEFYLFLVEALHVEGQLVYRLGEGPLELLVLLHLSLVVFS
jgi:hypothetical protein